MKFQDVQIGQQFRVTDPFTPDYMQDEVYTRVTTTLMFGRIYANAERVEKQGDLYDGVWVNGNFQVELVDEV